MLRRSNHVVPLITSLTLLAAACADGGTVTSPDSATHPGRGLTILLTDAPGDFKVAVVTISKIYLQGAGGPVVLRDDPFTGDLLSLRDDVATLVQGLDIPAGSYSQLRLVLSGAYIEVETTGGSEIFASSPDYPGLPAGARVDGQLQMPSLGTSGLKVKMPGGNLDIGDGETIVLIDFDVEQSFGHQAGRSGQWVMHPVVQATDVTFGGQVLARLQLGDGVTLPDLDGQPVSPGNFKARLTPDGGGAVLEIQLADPDADGVFEALFKGLPPGDYGLDFVVPVGLDVDFTPATPRTVTVVSKQTATQTFTITAAELTGSIVATLQLADGITLPDIGGNPTTLGQFQAELTPAGGGEAARIAFADSDHDGVFEATFQNLPAGDYSLTVVVPAGIAATFDVAVPSSITLTPGSTDTRPFVVTAASAS